MRHNRSKSTILNKANVPVPGEHYGVPAKPYVYGGTGKTLGVCSNPDHGADTLHPKAKTCVKWADA